MLLLKHVHCGLVEIPPAKLPNLLDVAHQYQVVSLVHIFLEQVQQPQAIDEHNVATYFYMGHAFKWEKLKQKCRVLLKRPSVLHEVLKSDAHDALMQNHPDVAHQLCLEVADQLGGKHKRKRVWNWK